MQPKKKKKGKACWTNERCFSLSQYFGERPIRIARDCGQCKKRDLCVCSECSFYCINFCSCLLIQNEVSQTSSFLKVTSLQLSLSVYFNQSLMQVNPSSWCTQCCRFLKTVFSFKPWVNSLWTREMLPSVICKIILLLCWMLYIARFKCCSETPFHLYAQYSPMASSQFPVPQRNHFIVILELTLVFHQEAKHMLEQLTLALLSI